MSIILRDRKEAGEKLSKKLKNFAGTQAIIYALPRGGVVVGHEIAKSLGLPLNLVITRKIGHQFNPEYAICAIAEDGHKICNEKEKEESDQQWLKRQFEKEKEEARRRRILYLRGSSILSPKGKTAIIVDDGIATGLSILLAIKEIQHEDPAKIIVAVPVAPTEIVSKVEKEVGVKGLVALEIDKYYLGSVGAYYENFPQIEDSEVVKIMSE